MTHCTTCGKYATSCGINATLRCCLKTTRCGIRTTHSVLRRRNSMLLGYNTPNAGGNGNVNENRSHPQLRCVNETLCVSSNENDYQLHFHLHFRYGKINRNVGANQTYSHSDNEKYSHLGFMQVSCQPGLAIFMPTSRIMQQSCQSGLARIVPGPGGLDNSLLF